MVELKPGVELDQALEKIKLLIEGIENHTKWIEGTIHQMDELAERITELVEEVQQCRRR